jgi:hypothetical protein
MTTLSTHKFNGFNLNGSDYLKIIPSKALFKSTMIHDVVNRGDCFALNLHTGEFTIIPGTALILNTKVDMEVYIPPVTE